MSTRISLLKKLTEEAGRTLLNYYQKELKLTDKSEKDFALEADFEIEKFILDAINSSFPNDSILSEEAGESTKDSEYLWIVDPLDGTANFQSKIPYFCCTIALQYKDSLVAAGVYDPLNKRLFFAEKGKGSFLNDERIFVSDVSNLQKFLISYSTSNHKSQEIVEKGSKLFHMFLTQCRAIRLQGSSILDLCSLASGTFEGLVKVGASYWDFAAGCLIVEEAGGKVTTLDGKPWSSKSTDIFASNGSCHDLLLAEMKKVIR